MFVAAKFLLPQGNSTQVGAAIVWTRGIYLVVPETVGFSWSTRRTLGAVTIRLFSSLPQYLRDYDADRGLRIVPPENLATADKAGKTLEGGLNPATVSRLAPDKCVDVSFGQFTAA